MAYTHLTVSPGWTDGTVLTESGEELTPPENWAFLPAGDAGVTRSVKAKGPSWVVRVIRGRRKISKGIWADAAHIRASKQEMEAKRATPAYARQRERALARRRADQKAYENEFFDQVVQFLNFHPRYDAEAARLGRMVTAHAVPVGSGTVARTQRIPVSERARAAVIAWMRHKTTAYENMKIARVKGKRREIRRQLAEASVAILNTYRRGLDIDTSCPLKKALYAEKTV